MTSYPPRLIEVDLPIKAISAQARREKSIRHGHISTLHIWWARRPLAACRAVLCAALWPDPADEACPPAFRQAAALALIQFAEQVRTDSKLAGLCKDHWTRWNRTTTASLSPDDPACWPDLRYALLDFIADFANWDASTIPAFLDTARLLTHVAHLALSMPDFHLPSTLTSHPREAIANLQSQVGNLPRPLVVDPFAGGGSIPLEALRIGADAFASDLNPVAVLLNKVVLEYIPKYGAAKIETLDAEGQPITFNGLAEAVRYWGDWIKQQAEKELARFYPSSHLPPEAYAPVLETERKIGGTRWKLSGIAQETPIAYIWARTIRCEGPGCGAEVPLMRSLWLAKKKGRSVALRMLPDRNTKQVTFELIEQKDGKWHTTGPHPEEVKASDLDGTMRRGSATCPVCGYTTPVERVRIQLKKRQGGAADARLVAVVVEIKASRKQVGSLPGAIDNYQIFDEGGRSYRLPTEIDIDAAFQAGIALEQLDAGHSGSMTLIPNEEISKNEIRRISVIIYGMEKWGDLFTPRQTLSLLVLGNLLEQIPQKINSRDVAVVLQTVLALSLNKQADSNTSICTWRSSSEDIGHTFGRQAIPMMWDFVEANVIGGATRDWTNAVEGGLKAISSIDNNLRPGHAEQSSATNHLLPSDSARAFITDPPYYDAVPYAYLSDFFYVWLRRSLGKVYPDLLSSYEVPKTDEIVVDRPHILSNSHKNVEFYEKALTIAFSEGRRILAPDGIGTIVFASKTTASWEAILKAVIDAGWTITGSWPIDTEMETRVAAQGQARLASSIHLVCRPREADEGSIPETVGDWRDVLSELPGRIHAWLPRLAQEGVVGADAIFACLGPALEIYSRYSRVETASGDVIPLGDVVQNGKVIQRGYLSFVWEAVAREALGMIFQGADASGFEADARLTAMWLWTLSTKENGGKPVEAAAEEELDADDEEKLAQSLSAYTLEYDAARKIGQGLGAHLEKLEDLVALKGDQARLKTVRERSVLLFGNKESNPLVEKRRPAAEQLNLFSLLREMPDGIGQPFDAGEAFPTGETTLARLHQAMLLFGGGRGEALKRFLVDQGVGKDNRFWHLAQALSALYPSGSDEKRWVDGVLARKKGLGF